MSQGARTPVATSVPRSIDSIPRSVTDARIVIASGCEKLFHMTLSRAELAGMVDHTLLKPEATTADVDALIAEARDLGVLAVCVSPSMLPIRAEGLVTAVVAGFPSGKHHSLIKGSEARLAVQQGADEVDMVIDVGAAIAGDYNAVLADIVTVREGMGPQAVLKVIIESAALSEEAIVEVCRAAETAGANFVKTST